MLVKTGSKLKGQVGFGLSFSVFMEEKQNERNK